ncbi:viroplasmin family protein [Aestuariirhabdus sp. LZHN29]|uniref:ribonuclease H1 domain-containing protein n=1 Tax=Aestuariirhabdus sp. LZHN29 TaxID=3417462 RepID=UPI003CE6E6EC
MAAKKYYVVWVGQQPGIYTSWPEAERQVKGYPGAKYKSFASSALAEAAYANKPAAAAGAQTASRVSSKKNVSSAASSVELGADVSIFCDGACDPNPGQAGTGIAIYHKEKLYQLWYGLYNPAGTNNTAELLGLHHSLLFAQTAIESGLSVTIYCDSRYAIDCITQWASGWKAKGWKRAGGEIKNLEIIKPAHALYVEIANRVAVKHVKGHAGVEGNELADRMSVVAIERQETDLCRYQEELSVEELLGLARG